ncbi:hypothetical protein J4573_31530 [Actinomadura barringtoniae]|uniref:Uncharacterized protein n=1 Tax=Actinomadura barringtoniae TaxID=1427535 RepID=A0A939T756_9ACTN|nr:hypothetical protein [Actinomadura barringtoniae]MBO2451659.1 hypothetical protein [Actinomadura barringtoniae]
MTAHQHLPRPSRHNTAPAAALDSCSRGRRRNPGLALTIAEKSFQLLVTGPRPLALDGQAVGHGLPARSVDLGELRTLLLSRNASDELKDAAWAELLRQARTGDPAWVVGCVGVAMPGLKSVAGRAIRTSPERFAEDIVSEILTEFVAQLQRIDITRSHIAARLLVWADRKGAVRARAGALQQVPTDPVELNTTAPHPVSEPASLLADAVRQQIITAAEAKLINTTRLESVPLAEYARVCGEPEKKLYSRRERAEARLVTAIGEGQVSAISASDVQRNGPFPGAS